MVSESLREVRSRLPEFVERVSAHHERVVITRNGSPAAVMMSPDDLESLEETLAMLEEQLAGHDPVTKWEFIVPTVPKEMFLPRVVKKADR